MGFPRREFKGNASAVSGKRDSSCSASVNNFKCLYMDNISALALRGSKCLSFYCFKQREFKSNTIAMSGTTRDYSTQQVSVRGIFVFPQSAIDGKWPVLPPALIDEKQS